MCSEKFLKNSIKLLRIFPVMWQTFFAQRTLKRHSRSLQGHLDTQDTQTLEHLRHLGTQKALWHSGTQGIDHLGTQAFEALRFSKGVSVLGHSRLLGTWALRHLGTWVLEGHLGTQELRHSGTWTLEAFEAVY